MDDSRIVEVYAAADAIEATAIRDALVRADIEARVVGDILEGGLGFNLGEAATPQVWVHEEDAPRARTVIAQWQAEGRLDDETSEFE